MKHKKGFTLVELVFVVIIVATLSAIGIPSYLRSTERSRAAEIAQVLEKIRTYQEQRVLLGEGSYATTFAQLPIIFDNTTSTTSSINSSNYTYSLQTDYTQAARRSRYTYTVRINNYREGTLCCTGTDCPVVETLFDSCS